MPKGPNGEKRPADAIARAVMIARIATGEIEDDRNDAPRTRLGEAGGRARAVQVSKERRTEIAKAAASARWTKSKRPQN